MAMSIDNNEHTLQYYVPLEVTLKVVNLSKVYASSMGRVEIAGIERPELMTNRVRERIGNK